MLSISGYAMEQLLEHHIDDDGIFIERFDTEEQACDYIGDKNNRFLGKVENGYKYFVFNWTENVWDTLRVDYPKLTGKHMDIIGNIEFDAMISKVNVPEDLELTVYACPRCGRQEILRVNVETESGYHPAEVCEYCSQISEDKLDSLLDEHSVIYLARLTFDIQVQEIIIKHPESMKKTVVYVTSNYPMFSKKDIGKWYTFKGYLHHSRSKSISYEMTAPHITPLPVDESIDETMNMECTRDDVSPEWRKEVLARDKHCVICGGEKHLEAHHIFGYKGYPQLRDNVDNGITLCQFCHGNYHSQYGVKNPNPVTLVKFVKQF
jgi:transcription elongation factor Elf1